MDTPSISSLSQLQNKYSARSALIEAVLSHVANDPEFGDELAHALIGAGCDTQQRDEDSTRQVTHAERIIEFMQSRGNPWLEVSQIRKATGIGRGSIANVLYKTHIDRFEYRDHPRHKARKEWRLKPEDERKRLLQPIGAKNMNFFDHLEKGDSANEASDDSGLPRPPSGKPSI